MEMTTLVPAMLSLKKYLSPFGVALGSLGAEGSILRIYSVLAQTVTYQNP